MSRLSGGAIRLATARRVDSEGELYARPAGIGYLLGILTLLTALEAVIQIFRLDSSSHLLQASVQDLVIVASGVLVLGRAVYEPSTRPAWVAFGAAIILWGAGSVSWALVYGGRSVPPYPTFADALWLLWYPLMAVGVALLIRVHLPRFELHRWMDGIAVTLLVLAGGFALVVQPVAQQAHEGRLATVIDFSYPVLDVLLMGAILGVYGLLGWRPDRMWILIGAAVLASTAADAAFAIQLTRNTDAGGNYNVVASAGALLMAWAAWVRVGGEDERRRRSSVAVTGLRAVALVLVAQALAAGIQVYALVGTVGKSERIITLIALAVTSVQVVLSRPRAGAASGDEQMGSFESGPEDSRLPVVSAEIDSKDRPSG